MSNDVQKHNPQLRELSKVAVALREAGKFEAAETIVRFTTALAPNDPVVLVNAGAALLTGPKSGESMKFTQRGIDLDATLAARFTSNLGLSAYYLGDLKRAIELFREVAAFDVDARYNLACATLLSGDWVEGMKMMEVRKEKFGHPVRKTPAWDGSEIDGALWVEAEQGIGDMVNFARFLPWARTRCKRLIFSAPAMMMPLFHGYPGVDELRLKDEAMPEPDDAKAYVTLHSIAHLSETTQETVPPDPGHFAKVAKTRPVTVERPPRATVNVGLCWAGNPMHQRDRERSMPFESVMPMLGDAYVQWFSLQYGARANDPKIAGVSPLIEDLQGEFSSGLVKIAGVIASLDLIVTVDTAAAHFGGAMGVPTWLMLPKVPDWRWGLGTDRTVWYPSVRLFRQKRLGEWGSVVESVRAALLNFVEGKATGPHGARSAASDEYRKLKLVCPSGLPEHMTRPLVRKGQTWLCGTCSKALVEQRLGPYVPPVPAEHHPVA